MRDAALSPSLVWWHFGDTFAAAAHHESSGTGSVPHGRRALLRTQPNPRTVEHNREGK
jgi:hypothetical protein